MNLFVPAGYYGSGVGNSNVLVTQGILTQERFGDQIYAIAGGGNNYLPALTEPFRASIKSNTGAINTGLFVNVVNKPLRISRTKLLELTVYFGVTKYDLETFSANRTYFETTLQQGSPLPFRPDFYYQQLRLAQSDGTISASLYNDSDLIGYAEKGFQQYANLAKLQFEDLGLDLTELASLPCSLSIRFSSSNKYPFGPVDYPNAEVSVPVSLILPNVGLSSRITTEAAVTPVAALEVLLPNDLVCVSSVSATAFADLLDTALTDINLRAKINASAETSGSLRGPVEVSAFADAAATATANQTMIVSLVANGLVAAEMVGIAYIGQTEFLVAGAVAGTTHSASLTVSSRVSGMTLYVNLETRQFVVSPVLLSPVNTIALTRRDLAAIDVQFIRGGRVVELSYGSSGQLGLKDDYSDAPLALDDAWTERGTGTATRYQFSLNLNTAAIDALFSDDDGTASASAKIELEWNEAGTINTTLPATATIYNDVLRGGEGVPMVTAASNFKLLASDSSLWTITIDPDGMLTATKS